MVDESVGGVHGRGLLEDNRVDRRSEGWGLGVVGGIFGGVRGQGCGRGWDSGRRRVGWVVSRLDANHDGAEGFERSGVEFGCGLGEGPCLGGVEGVGDGSAVLGTGEDRSSWEVGVEGRGEVVPGWAGVVEADVQRVTQITEQPMVRTMDRILEGGAAHQVSLHRLTRGDG